MNTPQTLDVSIILPVHDEEKNLPPLVERIVRVMDAYPHVAGYEVIMVDDASSDDSWGAMQAIAEQYPQLVQNHQHPEQRGQKGALQTGFANANGWLSVTMDADLQVLPEEMPLLLDKAFIDGYELICTYNDPERGGKNRGFVSRIGNIFMRVLFNSPVQDAGSNFLAVQTRYLKGVKLIDNDQRYLLPISVRRGLTRITEVGCVFGTRGYGKSKYNKMKKAVQGVPEMLVLKQRIASGFYDEPPVPPLDRMETN